MRGAGGDLVRLRKRVELAVADASVREASRAREVAVEDGGATFVEEAPSAQLRARRNVRTARLISGLDMNVNSSNVWDVVECRGSGRRLLFQSKSQDTTWVRAPSPPFPSSPQQDKNASVKN